MPAGFNKGQIEYIKTIANVGGHKTYRNFNNASQPHTATTGTQSANDNRCRYAMWCLGKRPVMFPTGAVDDNTNVAEDTTITELDGAYYVPINTNTEMATVLQRVTPECFLESVNVKMRHITNLDTSSDADTNSHKEFRLIVFRHREKQHHDRQLAENFSNPFFDLFHGANNTKYGPKGYQNNMTHDGNINYNAWSSYDADPRS